MENKNKGTKKISGFMGTFKKNEKGEIDIEVIDSGELTISKTKEQKLKEQDDLIV